MTCRYAAPWRRGSRTSSSFTLFLAVAVTAFLLVAGTSHATPTTPEQARLAAQNWMRSDPSHLGFGGESQTGQIETFSDQNGLPLYYVVHLTSGGLVIVSADNEVEPIIAFVAEGQYDTSEDSPFHALVSHDLADRVKRARETISIRDASETAAVSKWNSLTSSGISTRGTGLVSEVRVPPLVKSRWSQDTDNEGSSGHPCYNYYTPNRYPCGCVATAMSQLMRFHRYPTAPVTARSFSIEVNNVPEMRQLLGGDLTGGAYNWTRMVLVPLTGSTIEERQAIGTLTHDAGVAMNMSYGASGSGAYTEEAAEKLTDVFMYSNAVAGLNSYYDLGTSLNSMVNPNLDFGHPVILGITGVAGGHAIVCDGYGYDGDTLYHHLNMGWSGMWDIWYNLPKIDVGFDTVYKCIYNIFVEGSGEIISGRVLTRDRAPIANALVTAELPNGETYTCISNTAGVYAIGKIPSNTSFSLTAVKEKWYFSPITISTGKSVTFSPVTGNVWGADFDDGVPAFRLNVESTGISQVPITGTHPGDTSLQFDLPRKTPVTLTAPAVHIDSETTLDYRFLYWAINGAPQPADQLTIDLTMTVNVVAAAQYEQIPHLDSLEITGPLQMDEGASSDFTCIAHYTTGTTAAVTPIWSVDTGAYTTVDTDGLFTVPFVSAESTATLYATYTSDEAIMRADSHTVAVLEVVPTILRVTPTEKVVDQAVPMAVDVEIVNAPPFGQLQFDLAFDPSQIQLSAEPARGSPVSHYSAVSWPLAAELNQFGSGTLSLTLPAGETAAQRAGKIAQLQFNFIGDIASLPTDISILNSAMADIASGSMAHQDEDGTIVASESVPPASDIEILYPAGGCILVQGEKTEIAWQSSEPLTGNLRVELVNGSGESWELTAKAQALNGVTKWTVGKWKSATQAVYPDATDYYIRISTLDGLKSGICAQPFTICSPVSLQISGPSDVLEGAQGVYGCTALFTCGAQRDVTQQAKWKFKGRGAALNKLTPGVLTATTVEQDELCTLTVQYKAGKVKMVGTQAVTVKNQ